MTDEAQTFTYKCPECGSTNITVTSIGSIATEWKDGKKGKAEVDDVYEDVGIECDDCDYGEGIDLRDDPDLEESFRQPIS